MKDFTRLWLAVEDGADEFLLLQNPFCNLEIEEELA
jgi:hypothetical protein